ncbi:MAG: TlpA family protein disulfide reductase, partial [Gammaproteobacteria bacterium]
DGSTATIASLRGKPTLLWFVVTTCPSVLASMPMMVQELARLRTAGVQVVEVQAFDNLGQPGPGIAEFGRRSAGSAYGDPDWIFGTASDDLTRTYDPYGHPDIYYLLDSAGQIKFINIAPVSTMSNLLSHVAALT